MPSLQETARKLVASGTGILAADESEGTIAKRFAVIGLPVTFETRRDYREMLFRSHEAMSKYISGVILTEETLKQDAADGTPFVALLADANVIPGIKVDRGAFEMPGTQGEKITEGLDGLRQRLTHYAEIGARFAKWRGVIAVSQLRAVAQRHPRQCTCAGPLCGALPGGRVSCRWSSRKCWPTASRAITASIAAPRSPARRWRRCSRNCGWPVSI